MNECDELAALKTAIRMVEMYHSEISSCAECPSGFCRGSWFREGYEELQAAAKRLGMPMARWNKRRVQEAPLLNPD